MAKVYKVNVKHYLIKSTKRTLEKEEFAVFVRVTAKRQNTNFRSNSFMSYPSIESENFLKEEGLSISQQESLSIQSFLKKIRFWDNPGFNIGGLGHVYDFHYDFPVGIVIDEFFKFRLKKNIMDSNFSVLINLLDWEVDLVTIISKLHELAKVFGSSDLGEMLKEIESDSSFMWENLGNLGLVLFENYKGKRTVNLNKNRNLIHFSSFCDDPKLKQYLAENSPRTEMLQVLVRWNFAQAIEKLTLEEFILNNEIWLEKHKEAVFQELMLVK